MTEEDPTLEPGVWQPGSARTGAELAELERELGAHAWSGQLPALSAARGPSLLVRRLAWLAAAAAAVLLAVGHLRPAGGDGYDLVVLAGSPRVGDRAVAGAGRLPRGGAIESGPAGGVRLAVGELGSVELGPDTELCALDPAGTDAEHLFHLERGTLHAWISAAPRRFQVGTPAGLAVDLGCEYTATVEDDGKTSLSVIGGVVSFEARGRRVFVPGGAEVSADPARGPGTPAWQNAGDAFRAALSTVDGSDDEAAVLQALATVLRAEGADLSLTYWHLLLHRKVEVRRAAAERLAELVPPPPGVDPAACVDGIEVALEGWRVACPWS